MASREEGAVASREEGAVASREEGVVVYHRECHHQLAVLPSEESPEGP